MSDVCCVGIGAFMPQPVTVKAIMHRAKKRRILIRLLWI